MVAAVRRSGRNSNKIAHYHEESDSDAASDHEFIDLDVEFTDTKKRSKSRGNSSKKRKSSKKLSKKEIDELESNLPPNYLFQMLSQVEVDTLELALEWVESYADDTSNGTNVSFVTLINLVLRSCGSVFLFQSHDLLNSESSSQSVDKLTIAFSQQQNHKYPFKVLPHYKKNILDFFVQLIKVAHEKGLLYNYYEDENENENDEETSLASPLMVLILTWIGSLSTCKIRPLRYTSTIILLTIQNELSVIVKDIILSLEKFQRQLARSSKSSSKRTKVDILNNTIQTYHNHKDTILEYFEEIGTVTLGSRYRDIDSSIRQECIKYLSQSMIIYPEYFFQASFLRYFGWLLSDPSHQVRLEVTRVLLKLYKNGKNTSSNMGIGFRQFTERYKEQIIRMASIDHDLTVRLNTTSICCELLKIGFLDENDRLEIISIFFQLLDEKNRLNSLAREKIEMEFARFISIVNEKNAKNEMEKYSMFFEKFESNQLGDEDGKLNLEYCFMIKDLIILLRLVTNYFFANTQSSSINLKQALSYIFKCLYQVPIYSDTWENLLRFILFDTSSITFTSKTPGVEIEGMEAEEIKQTLNLSGENDQLYILAFLDGAMDCTFNSLYKRKSEELTKILIKLVHYLPSLQSLLIKHDDNFYFFISIFDTLINCEDENSNIYTVFKNMNQIEVFNEIVFNFLKFYNSYEFNSSSSDDVLEKFDSLFKILLDGYDNTSTNLGINIMNADIRLQIQNLIHDLVAEVKEIGNYDITTSNLKNIFKDLSSPLRKLKEVANSINLNDFVDNSEGSILKLVLDNIFEVINVNEYLDFCNLLCSTFLDNTTCMIQACNAFLDLTLVTVSWKLEELTQIAENNDIGMQSQSDIKIKLQTVVSLMEYFTNLLDTTSKVSNELSLFEGYDNKSKFKSIQKLNDLSTLIASKLIDLCTSVKIFFVKFSSNNTFKNFDEFFNSGNILGSYVTKIMPIKFQNQILDIFLFKESKVAQLIPTELERSAGENVNYEDLFKAYSLEDTDDEEMISIEEDNSEITPRTFKRTPERLWSAQKDLCIFTVKILALVDISMVNTYVFDRLKLNSSKIGGVYNTIIEKNLSHIKANSVAQEG